MADYYIYGADVWCEACAEGIKERLRLDGEEPADPDDDNTYDSDEWPQGCCNDCEEADSPQHCGAGAECVNPHVLMDGTKVGKFLENPLTTDGERYVKQLHIEHRSEVTTMWMDFYGLRCDLEATLYDAAGVMIEVIEGEADKVADQVAEFITLHGGLDGLAGSIEFKPALKPVQRR